MTGMPDRADGIQSESFDTNGKCTERRLAADADLTGACDRLAERRFQQAIFALVVTFQPTILLP